MIRLQKLLAGAGLGSRRTVEDWIRAGRVSIAGRVAQLGDRAGPGDDVRLDGRRLTLSPLDLNTREVLLYYKPVGEVTTRSGGTHVPWPPSRQAPYPMLNAPLGSCVPSVIARPWKVPPSQ